MENHWTAQDAAGLAEECMSNAVKLLKEKQYGEARTELSLAKYQLENAERMAGESGEKLLGIHRARYTGLVMKLRLRDHILTWLGF